MLNFPLPYRDELLYSVIARAGVRQGIQSPKQLLDEVFGSRMVIATIDLPSHLDQVANWLTESYTVERLIYENTLFPLYAPFVPEENRRRCLNWMKKSSYGSAHLALGVAASVVKTSKYVRYCPACMREQFNIHGEYYWIREWQVPGINFCTKHGQLINTQISRPQAARHRFIAASPALCPSFYQKKIDPLLLAVNEQVRILLGLPELSSPSFSQWTEYYHTLAYSLGYRRGSRQIDHEGIYGKINECWSRSFLQDNNLLIDDFDNSDTSWMRAIFRKHRKSFSFLQHIVVHQALLGEDWNIKEVLHRVQRIPVISYQRTTCETDSLIHTLSTDQTTWLSLLENLSPKQARMYDKALYARLYRADHKWLITVNSDKRFDRSSGNRSRVDWPARDQKYYIELMDAYKFVSENRFSPRRSKRFLLKQSDSPSTLEKNLNRLPLVRNFIENHAEDVSAYQIRRIENAYDSLLSEYTKPPRWRLMRKAGLSDERLTDMARLYLDRLLLEDYEIKRHS
ncbi:TnsD family Tn7-like transposition protein [Salinispira pacifica]|uniref:Transposon Tn7 transposition protein tnsD n=1 Tax=Salinispira pacifica TaxID=1307761 RepID=V5WKE9_9SPIO|nr:TnsD family Tn7-like transposition protein [Salinispira pacifica]AHC16014.1 Transposon Tn7 transposition protein tnsD [Salinispira pacifica]